MPRTGEHPETVKDYTSIKITKACELLTKRDGRTCYRYYAIDLAMDLLIKNLTKKKPRKLASNH